MSQKNRAPRERVHGASIDAILHPDNGRCPVEEEGEEAPGESVEA